MEILRCENLTKVYGAGDTCVRALDGVSGEILPSIERTLLAG